MSQVMPNFDWVRAAIQDGRGVRAEAIPIGETKPRYSYQRELKSTSEGIKIVGTYRDTSGQEILRRDLILNRDGLFEFHEFLKGNQDPRWVKIFPNEVRFFGSQEKISEPVAVVSTFPYFIFASQDRLVAGEVVPIQIADPALNSVNRIEVSGRRYSRHLLRVSFRDQHGVNSMMLMDTAKNRVLEWQGGVALLPDSNGKSYVLVSTVKFMYSGAG